MVIYLDYQRSDFSSRTWLQISNACPFLANVSGTVGMLSCKRKGGSSEIVFFHDGFKGGREEVHLSDLRWTFPLFRNIRSFHNVPFKLS